MAGSYDGLARMLVLNVGGKDNVTAVSHCETRLRFVLKDDGQANTDLIKSLDGVVSVVREDGQYQIVIGNHVPEVYESVLRTGKMEELGKTQQAGQKTTGKSSSGWMPWLISLAVIVVIETAIVMAFKLPVTASTLVVMVLGLCCGTVGARLWENRKKQNRRDSLQEAADAPPKLKPEQIVAPVKGRIIPLSKLGDDAFASGVLGQGIGFEPSEGKLYAPCSGEIRTFFPSGHAIGIHSDNGADILIHVGMDTVRLDGRGFTPKKEQGERTRQGELLLEFDLDVIREAGMSTETPMIVSNTQDYARITVSQETEAQPGDPVLETIP